MLKVVLDTNIVISALFKSQSNPALIVSLALQGRVLFCLSEDVFTEYGEVLARERFKALNSRQVKRLLAELKNKALFVVPRNRTRFFPDSESRSSTSIHFRSYLQERGLVQPKFELMT